MKGLKLKWQGTGRLRRAVLTLGVAGATAGGVLLVAAPAQALVGTDPTPGTVHISPASGPLTTTATWTTTDGCPSGFQTSAVLEEPNVGATTFTAISGVVSLSGGNPITTAQGFQDTIGNLLAAAGVGAGQSEEFVLKCASAASGLGNTVFYQDILVTEDAAGVNYSTSAPAPATNTTTTMVASPNPVATGTAVTMTATVAAANNAAVAGSVTFMNGTSVINTTAAPVTCTTATPPVCTASFTLTTGFATAGSVSLTAVFTPTNTATFNGSTSAPFSESVQSAGTITAGTIPVTVTVAATGTLTVTIPTATAVLTPNTAGTSATGNLGTITVADTRNSVPGFSVSGQEVANFAGSGLPTGVASASIPNTDLGWQPAGTVAGGAQLGPSSTNIGTAPAQLVFAHAGTGFGTDLVNPSLTLTIPAGTPTGTYTGGVVITYVSLFA